MSTTPDAFFLPAGAGGTGQRFCLLHRARIEPLRGAIVYIHPFAEEMNKSRRMASLQCHALAQAGYTALQVDLLGCGDSSGDFGDASWAAWNTDVVDAARWLQREAPAPLWLWGLRAGCLLAAEAAGRLDDPCDLLFWQPATAGKLVLQQFLRLALAADMLDGKGKGAMQALKQQLAGGNAVDVAGYRMSPGLASGLETLRLAPPARPARVEWLEVDSRPDAGLSPASAAAIDQWQGAGFNVRGRQVTGPSFWQTTEIEEAPALLAATLAALTARDAVPA